MTDILSGDSEHHELSIIKDPFIKDCIESLSIHLSTNIFTQKKYWWGKVEFKNGNSSGVQSIPSCESFEEVVSQVKTILNSVKQK